MFGNKLHGTKTRCLRFHKFGPMKEVLQLETLELGKLGEFDEKFVLVRWLASPINPCDFYIVQDEYGGYRPKLPAIAGVEDVGIVEKIGKGAFAPELKVYDHVIRYKMPSNKCQAGGGIWTEYSFMPPDVLLRVDPEMDLAQAATLGINPPTAYALLRAVVELKPGDVVIQNAANSSVGRNVFQLAKHFGYKTINLMRRSERSVLMAKELMSLGADYVFTEDDFAQIVEGPYDFGRPKLGLDSVGGGSALLVSRAIDHPEGHMISFGSISGESAQISPGISHQFFSIAEYTARKGNEPAVRAMFKELQQLIRGDKLRPPPVQFRQMEEFSEAVKNAICHGTKQILLLSEHNRDHKHTKEAISQ